MNHTATAKRIAAPSGNRDNDRWQPVCTCGWKSPALHSNRTIEGKQLAERDADDHYTSRHAREERPAERFTVSAMHKPSNGFDGPTQVDYWRVVDNNTGMRADGTDKYADRAEARLTADGLNAPVEDAFPGCIRCGVASVEDAGDHADMTGHWPVPASAPSDTADHGAQARRLIAATE